MDEKGNQKTCSGVASQTFARDFWIPYVLVSLALTAILLPHTSSNSPFDWNLLFGLSIGIGIAIRELTRKDRSSSQLGLSALIVVALGTAAFAVSSSIWELCLRVRLVMGRTHIVCIILCGIGVGLLFKAILTRFPRRAVLFGIASSLLPLVLEMVLVEIHYGVLER